MDFIHIDTVSGDSVEVNDIVDEDGEHWQIRRVLEDEGDLIHCQAYNLDNGDEDDLFLDPDESYRLYGVA